jgi:site-specific DNA recombinase
MYRTSRSKVPKSPSKGRGAVGYIRVSTTEQSVEGVSLGAQEARIRAYCEATGRALSEVIVDEAQSAKTLVRTGLQKLFADIRAGRIGSIVVLKLDRLTRSVRDLADIIDFLEKHDCGLVSVSEHVDTDLAPNLRPAIIVA